MTFKLSLKLEKSNGLVIFVVERSDQKGTTGLFSLEDALDWVRHGANYELQRLRRREET